MNSQQKNTSVKVHSHSEKVIAEANVDDSKFWAFNRGYVQLDYQEHNRRTNEMYATTVSSARKCELDANFPSMKTRLLKFHFFTIPLTFRTSKNVQREG